MLRPCLALALVTLPAFASAADDKPVVVFSEGGKFSVTMPEKPARKVQKVPTQVGDIEAHYFVVERNARGYLACYSDYPKGSVTEDNVQKVLDGAVDGCVKGLKGKLLSDEKAALGKEKHPGRELLIALPAGGLRYRARCYLVGDRLYQVVVIGAEDFVKGKAAGAFLDSFSLEE
jgi:hypothetical protein